MAVMGNSIPIKQAMPEHVALLRARDRTYRNAKAIQGVFVTLSIVLPIVSVALAANYPAVKPYLALIGLALLMLDTALLDPMQKDLVKRGAKLQEEFDTKVLCLPENRFVTGTSVDHEEVRAGSAKPLSQERETQIRCWYEPCVGSVPIEFARLICQRTNIIYDSRLRRKYGGWLLYATIAFGFVLAVVGLVLGLSFSELLLTIAVPYMPVMSWTLREYRRQTDTAVSLESLKAEFGKLWSQAVSGTTSEALERGAREVQDAIYRHRVSSPLVFDWVYYRLRAFNEDQAHHAAERLVQQVQSALGGEAS